MYYLSQEAITCLMSYDVTSIFKNRSSGAYLYMSLITIVTQMLSLAAD